MKQKDKRKRKKKKKKIKKKSKKKAKERAKEEKGKGEEVPGPSLEQWQKESVVDSGPGNDDALSLLQEPVHTGVVLVPFCCMNQQVSGEQRCQMRGHSQQ